MNIQELRRDIKPTPELLATKKRNGIIFVLDNINDVFNIGSAFRIADSVAAEKVYLCGSTVTPPNNKITRASINTENWIDWEYNPSTLCCLKNLSKDYHHLLALEITEDSLDYRDFDIYSGKTVLVIGNEVNGISKEVLEACDCTIKIPMHGFNNSMNCTTALAIVAFDILSKPPYFGA